MLGCGEVGSYAKLENGEKYQSLGGVEELEGVEYLEKFEVPSPLGMLEDLEEFQNRKPNVRQDVHQPEAHG